MKHLILIAGAAALGLAAPAGAQPGKGHGSSAAHAQGNHGKGSLYGYGSGGCPPGLAKKNNGCLPPGQAKKLYNVGHRFPQHYGNLWNYDQVPYDLRQQYGFGANDRYYYGDGYIYQVDPKTMLIQQVVSAILR
jgi:hypothetical protein